LELLSGEEPQRLIGFVDRDRRGCFGGYPIYSYAEAKASGIWLRASALIASQAWREIGAELEADGATRIYNGHPWAMASMYAALPPELAEASPESAALTMEPADIARMVAAVRRMERRHLLFSQALEGVQAGRETLAREVVELRAAAARTQAARSYDITPEEHALIADLRPLAATSLESLVSTLRAVQYLVDAGIPGALLECGVFNGAQVAVMLRVLLRNGITDREVYAYDTFNGMPEPDEEDICVQVGESVDAPPPGTPARVIWSALRNRDGSGSQWVHSPKDRVATLLGSTGYPMGRVHLVEGLVEYTLPEQAPERIALMRLDTDFYKSTRHELETLYPRLAHGGILILDDYGAFTGSRRATDSFFAERGCGVFLARVDPTVRIAVKAFADTPPKD
jgi:hypothetical protein